MNPIAMLVPGSQRVEQTAKLYLRPRVAEGDQRITITLISIQEVYFVSLLRYYSFSTAAKFKGEIVAVVSTVSPSPSGCRESLFARIHHYE